MGLINSKSQTDDEVAEGKSPATPIRPKKVADPLLDPRSPSANIVRTPIQTISKSTGTSPNIGCIITDNASDASGTALNIDPRSPTVEFVRTPIAVLNQMKLHNKQLDLVKRQMAFTPVKSGPAKPLEKSKTEASIDTDTTEEDTSEDDNPKVNSSNLKDSKFNNFKMDTPKLNSENVEVILRKPKLLEVTPITKKAEEGKRRHSILGLLETNLDYVETDIDQVHKLGELDSSLSLSTPELKPKLDNKDVLEIVNPAKDFDKKISNLIYEDSEEILSGKVISKTNGRNVLSERNGLQSGHKGHNKLKVNDHPTLPKYEKLSKIPVLKKKLKYCENTPPNSTTNRSEWDGDNTFII